MLQPPNQYPYNASRRTILIGLLLGGAGSVFMAYKAAHNQAGVIIEGIIRLGPEGATRFYWVITGICGMMAFFALLFALLRIVKPRYLVVEKDALLLPGHLFQREPTRIAYADIQELSEDHVFRQTLLNITVQGRRHGLLASLLPDEASYIAIRDFLRSQVQR